MNARRIAGSIVLAALFGAVGCSSTTPFEGEAFELVKNQPAHPFTVAVEVQQNVTGTQAPDAMVPAIVNEERKADIEAAIVRALEEYNTFSAAYPQAAGTASDLALLVSVTAPANQELGEPERNNLMWGSLFLWLLAGFPGWILEDTEMDTGIEMNYRLVRRFSETEQASEVEYRERRPIDVAEAEKLNFWRRAGLWQYTQQIIIPPFLVKSDLEKADQSMYEGFTARMQQELGQRIKQELARAQVNRVGSSIPFLEVVESGSEPYLLLFSDSELARGELSGASTTALEWINLNDPINEVIRKATVDSLSNSTLRAAVASYDYFYRATVAPSALRWVSATTPTRLLVTFRGDERRWSWSPRIGAPAVTQTASVD